MKRGDRVQVQKAKGKKYGMITGETKCKTYWMVLLDGNMHARAEVKNKVELLKPEQLAFWFGKDKL